MSNDNIIPIIDISPLVSPNKTDDPLAMERLKCEWDRAFRSLGFAIITGHSVDTALIESLYSKAKEWFHLPAEGKLKYYKNQGYGKGGFVPTGMEGHIRTKTSEDLVESLTYMGKNDFTELPPTVRPELQAYCGEMLNLLRPLMKLSAMALNLEDENFFGPHFTQPRFTFRLAYYPPKIGNESDKPDINQHRYGAHTDFIGFTILRQDPAVGGLEIQHPTTGEWIPVPRIPNSFVVNAGDLIQHWTNGLWKSLMHRVVIPSRAEAHLGRLSMVFFSGPNDDTVVAPLEPCVKETGGRSLHEPVLAEDYLAMKLMASNTQNI